MRWIHFNNSTNINAYNETSNTSTIANTNTHTTQTQDNNNTNNITIVDANDNDIDKHYTHIGNANHNDASLEPIDDTTS